MFDDHHTASGCHFDTKRVFCPYCCFWAAGIKKGNHGQVKLAWCGRCKKEFRFVTIIEGKKVRFYSGRNYDFSKGKFV